MKIRMKVDISGSFDGRRWPGRGETIDVPDNVGVRMVANGQAVAVAERPAETAVAPTVDVEERIVATYEKPERSTLTTNDGPVKRPRGRPRKQRD